MAEPIPTDFVGAGFAIPTDFEPAEEDVVLTIDTDKDEDIDPCECCKPCSIAQYTSACIRFSGSDTPFDELNFSPWINTRLLDPDKFLQSRSGGLTRHGKFALRLSGIYHDVVRNIYVCYTFLLEVFFDCAGDNSLVMSAIKPQDTHTVAVCYEIDNIGRLMELSCYAVKMPYGWGSPEPECDSSDDGKCFFYGVGYGPPVIEAHRESFCGFCGGTPIFIGSGTEGGTCSDTGEARRHISCPPVCNSNYYAVNFGLANSTNGPRPPQLILTSEPVLIDDIMDFELDLPADWFLVPYCDDLGLSGFALNAHIEFDLETCEFVDENDILDPASGVVGLCYIELNEFVSECPCTCKDALGCAGAWPPPAVDFTVAGLVNNPACDSCCHYGPAGTALCFNREWTPLLATNEGGDPAQISSFGSILGRCAAVYREVCQGTVAGDPSAFVSLTVEFSIYIDAANMVQLNLYLYGFIGMASGGIPCVTSRHYAVSYALASFNCAGSWVLADTFAGVGSTCDNNWPNTIEVFPAAGGVANLPPGCCNVTVDDTCTNPIPCPVPPCGEGNTLPGDPDLVTVPCCNREESISTSLRVEFVSLGGCPCLVSSFDITWSSTYKAWIGAETACAQFVTVAVWCAGGTFHARVWCGQTVILSFDGNFATGTGNCSPICIVWGGDLNQFVTPCCDLTGPVQLFVKDLGFPGLCGNPGG